MSLWLLPPGARKHSLASFNLRRDPVAKGRVVPAAVCVVVTVVVSSSPETDLLPPPSPSLSRRGCSTGNTITDDACMLALVWHPSTWRGSTARQPGAARGETSACAVWLWLWDAVW